MIKYSISKKAPIIFGALIVFFVSCENPFEQEIVQVESMQLQLNECEEMVAPLDANKVRDMYNEYGKIMAVIKKKYMSDSVTVDQKFGQMTNLYNGVKGIKGFGINKENILEEIAFTKTQLENLKDDLVHKDIDNSDTIKSYINTEQEALTEIKVASFNLKSNYTLLLSVQDTVYPYMKAVVDSLNTLN